MFCIANIFYTSQNSSIAQIFKTVITTPPLPAIFFIFITDLSPKINCPYFRVVSFELQSAKRYLNFCKPTFLISNCFCIPYTIPVNVIILPAYLEVSSCGVGIDNKKITISSIIKWGDQYSENIIFFVVKIPLHKLCNDLFRILLIAPNTDV